MTSRILYVPHVLGQVQGATTGAVPWLAGDPRVSFDNGQPVFGTFEHATAWFAAALDSKTTGPVDLAAVADATTYRTADGRTRVNLPVTPDQLREPHRQVAFTGPQLQPDPRVLRRQFRTAGAEAHTRWPPRPDLPRRPGSPDAQPPPVPELQDRRSRVAFDRGYQLGFSNAGYATHAKVAAALAPLAPAAAAAIHDHAGRCWTSRPPIPPHPAQSTSRLPDQRRGSAAEAGPAGSGPFPALARDWTTGLALGAAHGALHAAAHLRSTLLRAPHALPGVQPNALDAALRNTLAATVPSWAEARLTNWATGLAREPAPSPAPSAIGTRQAHQGNRPQRPRPAPAPASPAPTLPPPTPSQQPPAQTCR